MIAAYALWLAVQAPRGPAEIVIFTRSARLGGAVGRFVGPGYRVDVTADPGEGRADPPLSRPPRRWLAHIAWRGAIVFDADAFRDPASANYDDYESKMERVLADFADYYPRSTIYVAVPTQTGNATAAVETYFAPLARQAAREAGVRTIELSAAPTPEEAIADAVADRRVEKRGWKLLSADSEEPEEGPARNAIDGDLSTYWHTRYSPRPTAYPHELVVDMGAPVRIDGFRYVPRQDGGVNGRVKAYAFFLSADGVSWGEPVVAGELPNAAAGARVKFPAGIVSARYFKFVAKSEQNGGPWASAAEIDVLKARP